MSESDFTDEEQRNAIITTITLDISGKHLKEVPKTIKNFSNIEFLYISTNDIRTIPDEFFSYVPQLKWLDFRHNKIKCIPSSIGKHRHLCTLLLQGNEITRLPVELGNVPTITGLNIAENPLDYPPRTVLQTGTQGILKYLRLELQSDRLLIPELLERLEDVQITDNEGYLGSGEDDGKISLTTIKKVSRKKSDVQSIVPNNRSATLQPRSRERKWSSNDTMLTTQPRLPKPRKQFKSANPIERVRHSDHFVKKAMKEFEEKRMLALQREENSRTEMIVQRMRDREALKLWRQDILSSSNKSAIENMESGIMSRSHTLESIKPLGKKAMCLTEKELTLKIRIKEHARKLREYHIKDENMNRADKANEGKHREHDIQQLSREYRFTAFTGDLE